MADDDTFIPFPSESGVFQPFGDRLILGKVISYDYRITGEGIVEKDERGNAVPTGLLSVELLDRGGTRDKVPYIISSSGNGNFFGGLPELGSLCVVGFRSQNIPVILGFLPHGLDVLFKERRVIGNLHPGESIAQGSAQVIDNDGRQQFLPGGSIKWDMYGRLIITAFNYELVLGGLLSNEYTKDVATVRDPFTGNLITVREKAANGAYARSMTDKGDEVNQLLGKLYTSARQGVTFISDSGAFEAKGALGATLGNTRDSYVKIAQDGTIDIHSESGKLKLSPESNLEFEVGGVWDEMVLNDKIVGVAGNVLETVTGDHEWAVGGSVKGAVMGQYELTAALDILFDGLIIRLGSRTAVEAAVLGTSFLTFFNTHTHLLGVLPTSSPVVPMSILELSTTVFVK